MGFPVIVLLLILLCSPYYVTSAGSINGHHNILAEDKHGTPSVPPRFMLATRQQIPSGEPTDKIVTQSAAWVTRPGKYHGLRAKIGVWAPQIQRGHSLESGASIYVSNLEEVSSPSFNMFEAGFHVNPDLYNNSDVRFFTYWIGKGSGSAYCYNLRCGGFVPAVGAALVPGQAVAPPSTYNGEDRFITISLRTDPKTGHWVLYRDDLHTPSLLGHFPKELCPQLIGGAPQASYNGFVSYRKNERGPPMGSGHFPEEGEKKAAYFKNMKLLNSNADAQDPTHSNMVPWENRADCYRITRMHNTVKDGYMFYYGGPEGCSG